MKYFFGFLLVAIGFLIIWKSEAVYAWTGSIGWAEKYLGVGETRLFIKLVGLAFIVVAFLIMTGAIQNMLTFLFVPRQRTI